MTDGMLLVRLAAYSPPSRDRRRGRACRNPRWWALGPCPPDAQSQRHQKVRWWRRWTPPPTGGRRAASCSACCARGCARGSCSARESFFLPSMSEVGRLRDTGAAASGRMGGWSSSGTRASWDDGCESVERRRRSSARQEARAAEGPAQVFYAFETSSYPTFLSYVSVVAPVRRVKYSKKGRQPLQRDGRKCLHAFFAISQATATSQFKRVICHVS